MAHEFGSPEWKAHSEMRMRRYRERDEAAARRYVLGEAARKRVKEIERVRWFERVGEPLASDVVREVEPLRSWEEALRCVRSQERGDLALRMQNNMTLYLSQNARERYRLWNAFVGAARLALKGVVEQAVAPRLFAVGGSAGDVDRIQSDLVMACAEAEYCDIWPGTFFGDRLRWYVEGRWPVGIGTRGPNGEVRPSGVPADPVQREYEGAESHGVFVNWPVFASARRSVTGLPAGKWLVY